MISVLFGQINFWEVNKEIKFFHGILPEWSLQEAPNMAEIGKSNVTHIFWVWSKQFWLLRFLRLRLSFSLIELCEGGIFNFDDRHYWKMVF